ncbi:hypothetical protein [Streptomyces sp. NPDC088141]|uniref:hypothetical protein n=1 Tax=Streptomyces sp. NPDC088141 TaxID=3155179 RepID=UPI00342F92EC
MTGPGHRPAYGLSFDPRALTDLLQAPGDIRDLALAQLKDIVNADLAGTKLTGDLIGCRKVYVDSRNAWRIVYAQRPAPSHSDYPTEIHVVAVRPRARHDVYATAAARLGMARQPASALTHAARTRSPQLGTRQPPPAKPGPAATPGLPRPALPTPKGPAL